VCERACLVNITDVYVQVCTQTSNHRLADCDRECNKGEETLTHFWRVKEEVLRAERIGHNALPLITADLNETRPGGVSTLMQCMCDQAQFSLSYVQVGCLPLRSLAARMRVCIFKSKVFVWKPVKLARAPALP